MTDRLRPLAFLLLELAAVCVLALPSLVFPPLAAQAQVGTPVSLGSNQADGTTATSLAITTSQAVPQGGSILVSAAATVNFGPEATAASCSDSGGNTYSTDVSQNAGTSNLTTLCSTRGLAAPLPVGSTITVTWSGTAANGQLFLMQAFSLAGLAGAPVDKTATTAGTGSSVSSGATTPTAQANELLFGVALDTGSTTGGAGFVPGTNGTANNCAASGSPTYSSLGGVDSGSPPSLFSMYCAVGATGAYAAQATLTGNPFWQALVATYRVLVTTTTGLTSPLNPSTAGQAVTFTATVTCTGFSTNGETVTFKDNGITIGTGTLAGGVATFTTSSLRVGSHPIIASYPGDANCAASNSNTVTQVVQAVSGTTLGSSPNPSAVGQAVTFTATVTCTGFSINGEVVTFADNGVPIGTGTLAGGVASFTTTALALGSHTVTASYPGDVNCAAGTAAPLTQVVAAAGVPTFVCTPPNPPAGSPTTCTLTFASPLLPGTTIALNSTSPPGASITGCSNPTGGLVCGSLSATALAAPPLSAATLTLTCPTGCSGGSSVQLTLLSPVPGALALSVTITQPGLPPQTLVLDDVTWGTVPAPAISTQPTSEVKFCNNTAVTNGLSQTLGGTTQSLVFAGPATTFTLPLFGPASTCILQPQRVVAGAATNCGTTAGTAPCADGYLVVTLTTPGRGAALSCATALTGGVPAGTAVTLATNNGGTCQPQVQGTQLNLPCGLTAGTAAASTTVSNTCTNVLFDISSVLGACVNTPTFCVNPGTFGSTSTLGLNQGSATVTVQFIATPANGGTVGGIQLGQNTFSFAGAGIGTLIVAASPQLIPSNGTEASVVSATFGCTTGFTSVGGFPLSNTTNGSGVLTIGANGQIVVNGNAGCGAGLPGTFTFATPGPVLFDNGRSTEQVSCGPNGNVNAFGNGVSPFFAPTGSTFPLAFTCTGAAVLAIGAGVAGDAPINVTYTSAVGGLQAVGSTLLTVSPAGIPRLSVACNPSSISAGNTGSLCTATVTDSNGVPLSGITGATVTFTTSDTSTTTILPCTIGTPGAINVTTSPAVIPLVTPQAPCVTPSTVIPGQVNTFINGQATALLVASSTAHPEVVTVAATLGVLIPPSFACLVAPYVSSGGFGAVNAATQPGYYAPYSGTGVYGCGSTTPIGTTGLATALNVAGGGLTGIVTLPNQTSASTTVTIGGPAGIQVAGATAISPVVLSHGCNNVIITAPAGTPVANIAALVSPQNAVVSIWRFDNGSKLFRAGWFANRSAPEDFATTGSAGILPAGAGTMVTESYYICLATSATMS